MKLSANGIANTTPTMDKETIEELIATRPDDLIDLVSRFEVRDYHDTVFEFIDQSILGDFKWTELTDLLALWQAKAEDGYGMYCNTLPILSCLAVGGEYEQAIPLSASWSLDYLAQQMLNDLQDQGKDDMPWSHWSARDIMSIALGALFAAQSCLAHTEGDPQIVSDIQHNWSGSHLLALRGQAITQDDDLSTYFERTAAYPGLIFGAACWRGAKLVTSDTFTLHSMQEFGIALGMAVQLGDDLKYLSRDLQQGHLTLAPLLALTEIANQNNQRLDSLLQNEAHLTSVEINEVLEILKSTRTLAFGFQIARTYQAKALMYLEKLADVGGDTDHLRIYTNSLLSSHDSSQQS